MRYTKAVLAAAVPAALAFSQNEIDVTMHKAYEKLETGVNEGMRRILSLGDKTKQVAGAADFEVLASAVHPDHQVRIKASPSLCDPTVQQYSGYLDVGGDDDEDSAHLFFWFFEARHKPAHKPLTLWVNGGPGASSSMGLLMELGPCNIDKDGKNTTYNPYSWNEETNILFLDQPVKVGYSYGERKVESSRAAAHDVYVFFQLLYAKFPHLAENPFHITGESYGGTYIPNFAAYIVEKNLELQESNAQRALQGLEDSSDNIVIPLASIFVGNGLTDPVVQFPGYYKYSCESEYAYLSDNDCAKMENDLSQCVFLLNVCQSLPSKLTCGIATARCWNSIAPIQTSGLNPYDIREPCVIDENLCYEQTGWIKNYLNNANVKAQLGVPKEVEHQGVSTEVHMQFTLAGDVAHATQLLVPYLVENGIRTGFYSGEYDAMCNWMGNLEWMEKLEWPGQEEFLATDFYEFSDDAGTPAGLVRKVGKGAGYFTYVKVYDAGHMVPYNVPDAALHLFRSWIHDVKP